MASFGGTFIGRVKLSDIEEIKHRNAVRGVVVHIEAKVGAQTVEARNLSLTAILGSKCKERFDQVPM